MSTDGARTRVFDVNQPQCSGTAAQQQQVQSSQLLLQSQQRVTQAQRNKEAAELRVRHAQVERARAQDAWLLQQQTPLATVKAFVYLDGRGRECGRFTFPHLLQLQEQGIVTGDVTIIKQQLQEQVLKGPQLLHPISGRGFSAAAQAIVEEWKAALELAIQRASTASGAPVQHRSAPSGQLHNDRRLPDQGNTVQQTAKLSAVAVPRTSTAAVDKPAVYGPRPVEGQAVLEGIPMGTAKQWRMSHQAPEQGTQQHMQQRHPPSIASPPRRSSVLQGVLQDPVVMTVAQQRRRSAMQGQQHAPAPAYVYNVASAAPGTVQTSGTEQTPEARAAQLLQGLGYASPPPPQAKPSKPQASSPAIMRHQYRRPPGQEPAQNGVLPQTAIYNAGQSSSQSGAQSLPAS
ncbi:hypothetical protein WJX73_002424 [Symbiochloris irregularis]|uniref:Uncharacterized protein n=1 Tax=Symbiochloris irregularis TaxID=706552 RepID=A0AAW1NW11_9CHLO